MITVVYGPPCAGKSTYIKEHAGPHDLIVDTDLIYEAISNRDCHDINYAQYAVASELRELLCDIVRDRKGRWENAWVTTFASSPARVKEAMERVNADEAILIDTPKEVCLERAKDRPPYFSLLIEEWFSER